MDNKKMPKNAENFWCNFCDFKCCKLSNYNKHCLTPKHKKHKNDNENGKNDNNKMPKNALLKHVCECGCSYNFASGLSRHKNANKCITNKITENPTSLNEVTTLTGLMLEVVKQNKELINQHNEASKQNQELQKQVIELSKSTSNNNSYNTTHTNSHNKSFNLNFFLNETCKDAMNISDFVDSIKLQLSDLEGVGQLGYVEGISNIIVKNLKQLDITQRPVHCTDKKRETIYIKDDDKWEKDEEKDKMHKIVRKVADKNARMLPKFKEAHPDCNKAASKYSDAYNKIIVESMGGSGDNNFEKEEKIIKKITLATTINKD